MTTEPQSGFLLNVVAALDDRPAVFSANLPQQIETLSDSPHVGLFAPAALEIMTLELGAELPRAVSVKIAKTAIKTFGFAFPELPVNMLAKPEPRKPVPPSPPPAPESESSDAVSGESATGDSAATKDPADEDAKPKLTRIKPPGDIVKLQDRLYYVLQPPLESLISAESLPMPFTPFPYQFEGIGFLYPRYAAVLADEMGLGKTMQAITAIRLLLHASEIRNVLLICPKPLVSNWKREFAQWAPEVPIAIIEGDQAKRQWQWSQANSPVKIANYELLMRDRELVTEGQKYDLVVLDEAQRIKNGTSTTSEIVKAIPRSRSWAMTGTPIENHCDDLVGIFDFLSPGYLKSGMPAKRMAELAGDFIIRRTKDKVLKDMPPKLFRDAELELTPEQLSTYKAAEDEGVIQLNEMGDSITVQHVFELVLRLKQICNFDPMTGASAKLERLEADLEEVAASGQKAIVFSQWVRTIAQMRERLNRFGILEYHGQMPNKLRETVIDQFKHDPSKHVILMSYGAGSVGLNLQFCRYVFLFDRWWNPAIEDQAINRAHRIGAAGSVTVTRMLAVGTIEERINQVLEHKRELFNILFSQTGAPTSAGLSQSEIFGLFNLRLPTPQGKKAA